MTPLRRSVRDELILLVGFVLVASLFAHWAPTFSDSSMALSRSMVFDGDVEISEYANTSLDVVRRGDSYYSDKPPVASLIAAVPLLGLRLAGIAPPSGGVEMIAVSEATTVSYLQLPPAWFVARFLAVFLTAILPGGICLVLVYRRLREHHDARTAFLSAFALGFGSVFLFYGSTLLRNVLAATLLFGAYHIIREGGDQASVIAGLLVALAVGTEFYVVLAVVPLLWLVSDRIRYLAGLGVGAIPTALYNLVATGNPLLPPVMLPSPTAGDGIRLLCDGGCGVFIKGFALAPLDFVLPNIARLLVYPSRGLFVYCPIFLVAAYGLYRAWGQRRREMAFVAGFFGLFLLFNASWAGWRGGFVQLAQAFDLRWAGWHGGPVFGPRYILPAVPFLTVPLAAGIDRLRDADRGHIVYLLLAVSVLIALLGFNGTEVHPTRPIPQELSNEGITAIGDGSFAMLLNPLPTYIDRFMRHGPRSLLLDAAAGQPWANLEYRVPADHHLAGIRIGDGAFLVLSTRFMELGLLAIIFGAMAISHLHRDRWLGRWIVGSLVAVLVLVLAVHPVLYADGWWRVNGEHAAASGATVYHAEGAALRGRTDVPVFINEQRIPSNGTFMFRSTARRSTITAEHCLAPWSSVHPGLQDCGTIRIVGVRP